MWLGSLLTVSIPDEILFQKGIMPWWSLCFYYMVKSSKFLINKYEDYEEKLKNKMWLGYVLGYLSHLFFI
jgi:hypothetical protein